MFTIEHQPNFYLNVTFAEVTMLEIKTRSFLMHTAKQYLTYGCPAYGSDLGNLSGKQIAKWVEHGMVGQYP